MYRLAAAVSYGHLELAKYLLSKGANVNLTDLDGNTALHFCESVAQAKLLVESGANVFAVNNLGHTAAQVALEDEFEDVIEYLVSCGCPQPAPLEEQEQDED